MRIIKLSCKIYKIYIFIDAILQQNPGKKIRKMHRRELTHRAVLTTNNYSLYPSMLKIGQD